MSSLSPQYKNIVLSFDTLNPTLNVLCQQDILAVVIFIASLTLIALAAEVTPTRPYSQSDVWRDLLTARKAWNDNYPVYRRDYHISSYKRSNQDKLSKILLVGGKDINEFRDTWIYTPWSNSWYQIATDPHFPSTFATAYEVLPSLCNTLVILIHDVKNVWIFDGSSETWSRHQFHTQLPVVNETHDILSQGAVALDSSNCTDRGCSCSGSVLFYYIYQACTLRNDDCCLQIRELQCSTKQHQIRCRWTRFMDKLLSDTDGRRVPAVADSRRGVVYFSTWETSMGITFINYSTSIYANTEYSSQRVSVSELEHKSWRFRYVKGVCFSNPHSGHTFSWTDPKELALPYNLVVWKDILLVSCKFPLMYVLFLKDLYPSVTKTASMFNWRSDPMTAYNPPFETIFSTQSLEIVRFYWKPLAPTPSLSLYRCTSNYSLMDARRMLPSFSEMKLSLPPLRSPNHLYHHASVYDYHLKSFYVYGGLPVHEVVNLTKSSPGDMWTLSMPSATWWLIRPEKTPTAYISSCGTFSGSSLVLFGGKYQSGTVGNELWLYSAIFRTWKQVSHYRIPWPVARAACTLTAASSTTEIILFGGYSYARVISPEVWSVTINNGRASWQRMTWAVDINIKAVPSPRFGHSAVILENELIIYGGRNSLSKETCLSDMWAFNMLNQKWRQIVSSRHGISDLNRIISVSGPQYCETFMLPYGSTKVALFQNGYGLATSMNVSNRVWMVDVSQKVETHILSPKRSVIVQAAGIWDGGLVYFGKYRTHTGLQTEGALLALGQKCKPGTAQQWGPGNGPCEPCPAGWYSYSSNYTKVSECIICPKGSTTTKPGMNSVASCICDITYCKHGSCKMVAGEGGEGIRVDCTCSFGFVGDRCQQINSVVFAVPFVVSSVVTTVVGYLIIRTIRHRRAKQRTERELEETRRAFTIQPQEIQLQCRLDEDCPGGYGQVHKATYRDWTVAVKQLQIVMAEWADIRKDFLREIQFMRTIRHPNIVMFVGAGQYDENCPFLVLEFMSGGALHSLLQNVEEELTRRECLQFALDTAVGMNYLHTLRPPRIHRDLKSANLLLSCTRQVRVADFGSARLIPESGRKLNKRVRRRRPTRFANGGNCSAKLSQRLLSETTQLTSRHIGTARWRSPELWRKMSYGTATDVYRYNTLL